MGKRKSEDKEEKRERKIRKLEEKLKKYKTISSIEDDPASEVDPEVEVIIEEPPTSELQSQLDVLSQVDDLEVTEEELPQDILKALGDTNSNIKGYGEKIHPNIFQRIEDIIVEGLNKEQKEEILKNYLIPENCTLLEAPKLNIELMGVIKSAGKSRDRLLQERQQELGVATATICKAINNLTKEKLDKLEIIKMLGDASRLLSNLHFQYTEIRRKMITPFIDKDLSQNLKENRRSEFLYTKLDDTVKSITTMKRASNILKPKPVPTSSKNSQLRRTYHQFQNRNDNSRGKNRQYQRPVPRTQQPGVQFKTQDRRPAATLMSKGRAKYP